MPSVRQLATLGLLKRSAQQTLGYGPQIAPILPTSFVTVRPGDSIATAITAAGANGAIYLLAGTHTLENIAPLNGQTFIGQYGAIVSGADVLTGWTASGSDFYVTGQTQEFGVAGECEVAFPMCDRTEDVYYDNVPLLGVASQAALATGKFYFDHAADRIYIRDTPTGHVVETNKRQYMFLTSTTATGVTVKNLIIEKYACSSQTGAISCVNGANWTIADNTIRLNHALGLDVGAGGRVLRNAFSTNGQLGLAGGGAGILVEGNEIAYNNYAHFDTTWEAGGLKFTECDGLVVRNNFCHHNYGVGLWTDENAINVLYERNIINDNWAAGLWHEISYAAIIRYNVVRRNGSGTADWAWGAGILVFNSPNVEVHNNVVADNADGIIVLNQDREEHVCENVWIHDNEVEISSDGWVGLIVDMDVTDFTFFTSRGNQFTGNRYLVDSLSDDNFVWNDEEVVFSAWQAFTPVNDTSCTAR